MTLKSRDGIDLDQDAAFFGLGLRSGLTSQSLSDFGEPGLRDCFTGEGRERMAASQKSRLAGVLRNRSGQMGRNLHRRVKD